MLHGYASSPNKKQNKKMSYIRNILYVTILKNTHIYVIYIGQKIYVIYIELKFKATLIEN